MKYKWKTTPYKHQVRAIRKLLKNGYGGALLMDPRTGKTKTTIDWLSILAQGKKIDRAIIFCPARVTDVWVEEFHKHSPLLVNTFVWDAKQRRAGYLPPISGAFDLTVVIVNYEAFATPGKRLKSGRRSKASGRFKTRALMYKWLGSGKTAACVLDESHKIKSPSGKAANMVVSLHGKFPYRVILTGTPVTKAKRIHDVYMQWKFLNPSRLEELDLGTIADIKAYTGVWINKNGYEQWLRSREKNVERLRWAIHKDAFAVKREDCFDLPPRDVQEIMVPLSAKTARLYDKLAIEMVAELMHAQEVHTVEASIVLVQQLRLAQITGGVATTDEKKLIRVGREKLDALKELIEKAVEEDEKVVIAARFKADLNAITKLMRSMSVPTFELRGGMSRDDGTRSIRDFRRLDGSGAFVMQPQSGSLGIDLSTASRMVWYSLTSSWVDWTQCCDRIALSRKSTTFTYLLAPGTVDTVTYNGLKTDTDIARMITTRPELLLRNVDKQMEGVERELHRLRKIG
jgi:SNF2 family DNA or RNA helicase